MAIKVFVILASIAAMFCVQGTTPVTAQTSSECESEEFSQSCTKILAEYRYVRTFGGIPKSEETEYPTTNAYLFSKGTSYLITACDNNIEDSRVVVNLYNQMRKLIASNFSEETGHYYDKIVYNCAATGIFYIQPIFEDSKGGCGISILGFKKL